MKDEILRLLKLDPHLRSRIRGQEHVIPRVVSVLLRGELGLAKEERPRGSFLFLGPTGVGKTELTLAFTSYLFGPGHTLRFDMSEYQTQESLGILLGGRFGEMGTLGMALEHIGAGTLLFDEIEKAHPRVIDIFLQVLDAARITLASGVTLDLSKFYVVFTSNLGAAELMATNHSCVATTERYALSRAQQALRPELFARLTEKVVFRKLDYDTQMDIARVLLEQELEFFERKGHPLTADASVLAFLVRHGFHPRLGARPMRDTIEKQVGDAVAEAVLSQQNGSGQLYVARSGNKLAIRQEPVPTDGGTCS